MKIAYFDCFSGISGDMILGALVDCGLDGRALQAQIDKLGLPEVHLEFQHTSRQGIGGTRAEVFVGPGAVAPEDEHHAEPGLPPAHGDAAAPHEHGEHGHHHEHSRGHAHGHDHEPHGHSHDAERGPLGPHARHEHGHPHAHLHDEGHGPEAENAHRSVGAILTLIEHSGLDDTVKAQAVRIFTRLAEAESRVHGTDVAQVHLHEVGALDAVVDVVGAVAGLHLLGVEKVYSSPLRFGTGLARCAHGRYPVPVPGVLALCAGVPCEQTEVRGELVTPTGAAILTTLAAGYGTAPVYRQTAVGYGAGRRDLPEVPNLLRVRLGDTQQTLEQDRLMLVECNIDDMNPEVYGYLFGLLLERGARDVYVTPVQMKKGRPGSLLSVLADPERLDAVVSTVLSETTTIGVRYHAVERRKLQRRAAAVLTRFGTVQVKVCHLEDGERITPEYEDCARLARERQIPLLEVYAAARSAAEKLDWTDPSPSEE